MRWQDKKMGSHLSGNEVSAVLPGAKQYVRVVIVCGVTLWEAKKKENEKVSFHNVRAYFGTGDLFLCVFLLKLRQVFKMLDICPVFSG